MENEDGDGEASRGSRCRRALLKIGSPTSHRHGAEADGFGIDTETETETAASMLVADCKLSAAGVGLWKCVFALCVSVCGRCSRVVVSSQGTASASSGFPWVVG